MSLKWTKEAIVEVANKCSTKSEFTKLYGGAYNAARNQGILEEICTYFDCTNVHWTAQKIHLEASKYKDKKSFRKNSRGAYEAAVRLGINTFTKHMKALRKTWTLETAIVAAKQYKYRGDFMNNCSGAYSFLSRINKLDIACSHMWTNADKIKWTKENIFKEAIKYTSRNTFKLANSVAYQAMLKLGLSSELCAHMEDPKCVKYTYEQLASEALKYKTKSDFKRNSYGHYQAACKHEQFDQMTTHMEDASKFSMFKPSVLYYFKIYFESSFIWKIGITNYSVEDRYYRRDINRMEDILEIPFNSGAEAYNAEQTIIKLYKDFKYTGKTPFTDGTGITECFKQDISKEEFFISLRSMDSAGNPKE